MTERNIPSFCQQCPLSQSGCEILKPISFKLEVLDHKFYGQPDECAHFTCQPDGMPRAAEAFSYTRIVYTLPTIHGELELIPFGSMGKPTCTVDEYLGCNAQGKARLFSKTKGLIVAYSANSNLSNNLARYVEVDTGNIYSTDPYTNEIKPTGQNVSEHKQGYDVIL